MRNVQLTICLAAMIMGASASAALIASESFSTRVAAGDYTVANLDNVTNKGVVVGNTGFAAGGTSATDWFWGTAFIQPTSSTSLTHSLVAGSTSAGAGNMKTINAINTARTSDRNFANRPASGTTFYMSGLVNVGSLSGYSVGEGVAMGAGQIGTQTNFLTDQGWFLGVTTDADGVHLAAFAGNNTYKLGDALTAQQASETQMIVLEMEYGAGAGGLDALTAWTAQQSATNLTLINSWDVEAGDRANIYRFMLSTVNGSDTSTSTTYLDEFRLGTTLQDVTSLQAVPGLRTLNLFILSLN